MVSTNARTGLVKSDETLFRLIEALQEKHVAGVTELADQLDCSKSSVHKHLKTLEHHDYAVNDDGQYSLGFKFLTLGGNIRDRNNLCQYARSFVTALAEDATQMVSFIIRDGDYGVFACINNDRYGLRAQVPLGSRYPLSQNAAGKAILAKLPDEEIETYIAQSGLPSKTQNTISEPRRLWEEIEEIRNRGYALSIEERVEGVLSIAAAIKSNNSNQVGALAMAGPVEHLSQDRIHDEYAALLLEAAYDLKLRVRYSTQ